MANNRQWWIEFTGDDKNDKEQYKRYVSGTEFKPLGLGDEVIRVIEYKAYEDLQNKMTAAVEMLRKCREKAIDLNDDFR